MNRQLKRDLLRALLACDGLPMPESSLMAAVALLARPLEPTQSDILTALKEVEAAGYVSGLSDDLDERSWTLTPKGAHRARTL